MKKLSLLAASALIAAAVCGSAYAAPLKNYDPGHFAVDLGLNVPTDIEYGSHDTDKETSFYAGATAGIGNNMALNYKYNKYDADDSSTDTNQLNLMYKVLPGLSAYAGYLNADTSSDFGGKEQDSVQVGLSARYDIPAFFTIYGNVAAGTNNSGYEVGISKPFVNNVELNLSYYDQKFDDALAGGSDLKARGINLGVTLAF